MNIFGSIVVGVMSIGFILGTVRMLKTKAYKYAVSLGLLLVGIALMVAALIPNLSGEFGDLIFTLFAFVFFILSGITGGVTYILRSLKKNK